MQASLDDVPPPAGESLAINNDGEVELVDEQHLEAVSALKESNSELVAEGEAEVVERGGAEGKTVSLGAFLLDYAKSPDFKELAACIVLALFLFFIGYAMDKPTERPIPKQQLADGTFVLNLMYSNDSEGDTVPNWALGVIAVAICPLLQFALSLCVGEARDFHRTMCVYILAIPTNELVTWLLKAYTGYLRPHFYEGCVPNDTYEYCLDPYGEEQDMRSSFPSGHASWAFVSLTMLYLYLERSFGITSVERAYTLVPSSSNDNNEGTLSGKARMRMEYVRPPTLYRLTSIICTAPLFLAGFTAASRVVDNRHHPADIVAGSLIGAFEAWFFHSSWFHDARFAS